MFLLRKWYLDVVTNDGAVLILYAARLHWGQLLVRYASLLLDEPSGRRVERATTRVGDAPRSGDDGVTWHNATLDVRGRWRCDAAPIHQTLASGTDGTIRWTCHVPRGRASVCYGTEAYEGTGYVECLRLTIPPWKLPLRTLRWGRHASDRHSLVWIDWEGTDHRTWVWLDGVDQRGATVTDSGLTGLAPDTSLRAQGARDVRDRRVLATITDHMPALARRVAGPLAGMHEHKCVERSSIVKRGQPVDDGWTLREVVTW